MIRGLVFLLVVRVFGAPVTLRPHARTGHPPGELVFRVCNWPEERRLTISETLVIGETVVTALLTSPAPARPHGPESSPTIPPDLSLTRFMHRSLGALRI